MGGDFVSRPQAVEAGRRPPRLRERMEPRVRQFLEAVQWGTTVTTRDAEGMRTCISEGHINDIGTGQCLFDFKTHGLSTTLGILSKGDSVSTLK